MIIKTAPAAAVGLGLVPAALGANHSASVVSALGDIEKDRKIVLDLDDAAKVAERAVELHGPGFEVDINRTGYTKPMVRIWGGEPELVAHVAPILRYLARNGYRQTRSATGNADKWSSFRFWNCGEIEIVCAMPVQREGEKEVVGVDTADEESDSTVRCRYVQVGVRTVEEPVFELRCEPVE